MLKRMGFALILFILVAASLACGMDKSDEKKNEDFQNDPQTETERFQNHLGLKKLRLDSLCQPYSILFLYL